MFTEVTLADESMLVQEGREIYPAETDRGRTTKTTSEFDLRIDPRNFGVMLRRKLDYSYLNLPRSGEVHTSIQAAVPELPAA